MREFLAVMETILGVAAVLSAIRLVRGPSLPDRMVALDLILVLVASLVAVEWVRSGGEYLVPVLVVIALVSFIGTVIVARFIEERDT